MAQRILRGAAATLTYTHLDADGDPVAASGTLTVAVAKADGTVVLAAGTATVAGTDTGVYTVDLTGAQTASLELLTATWTDSAVSTAARTTLHEIVGGYVFSIAQVRAFETLSNDGDYPTEDVIVRRAEVEDEVEWICDRAFVTRYSRLTVDSVGDTYVDTGLHDITSIRSIRMYATPGASTYTALTATQLAGCVADSNGRITRTDVSNFTEGVGNIVVEVEYGYTGWGENVRRAMLTRLREFLNHESSAISDRAASFTNADGDRYDLAGQDIYKTGNAFVDAVYERVSKRRRNDRDRPASGSYQMDPSYFGLFRGGRR